MYAFCLCIFRQIAGRYVAPLEIRGFIAIFRLSLALHTPISPIDLEFRGHAHFFERGGCVSLPWTSIVGRRNGIFIVPEENFKFPIL
jgi:hypothetical protein